MGHTFRKVQSGERLRIPAAAYNAFVDVVRDQQARQRELSSDSSSAHRSSGLVLVKNASGADRNRFDILGIDSPLFTPSASLDSFSNRVVLSGVTPTATHAGRFIILAEPLKANAIGTAWCAGVCPVKVDVQSTLHTAADIIPSSSASLRSSFDGTASILWKESGTGTRWAIIRFGSSAVRHFDARLTASARDGVNLRWKYDFVEVQKNTAGYGGWTTKSGGRTGSVAGGNPAYNRIEDRNTTSGLFGNGVSSTNLTGAYSIMPAPAASADGVIVEMAQVPLASGGIEYWFSYENAVDGRCEL